MISTIRKNRIAKYLRLQRECITKQPIKVYPRDTDDYYGFVIGDAPPYYGEAGYSTRAVVLWPSGKTTWCCYKGMKEQGIEKDRIKKDEFWASWKIL